MDDSWYHETWPDPRNASGITRLELIAGWPSGIDASVPELPELETAADPIAALERALLPALRGSRCFVAFSGGRDSSVLLALATGVARREGFSDPVPLTVRFASAGGSEETEWQEAVIEHLRLTEWQILGHSGDLDLLGPEAQSLLRKHGLQFPASAHAYLPLQRAAKGGFLVHGDGGDQIFAGWARKTVGDLLARRRAPRLRDWRILVRALAPAPVRRSIEMRRAHLPAPWLDPAAVFVWRRHEARALAAEPRTWPGFLRWIRRERATNLTLRTFDRQSDGTDSTFLAPFWDPGFLVALSDWGGRFGGGGRTALMLALFGDLLPEKILRRATKAHFSNVFFGDHTRAFARSWTGPAPEPAVVRPEPLRRAWLSELPPTTCALLLQASWLASLEA